MTTEAHLNNIVKKFISPQLKVAGFKKKSETWNRNINDIVHVINVQESRWNDSGEVSFTLNIGIMVRSVESIVWGKEPSLFVPDTSCFPRFRVGYLPGVDVGKDIWWRLQSNSQNEDVGTEVCCVIKEKCLPLLDRCCSISNILELIKDTQICKQPADKLALAVLMCLGGQEKLGNKIINEILEDPKLKGWYKCIEDTKARLIKFVAEQ